MPERPWADEYTLLCERCGYVVEGLDPAGACPECGKPIAESLPERRVGTAWQREPGWKAWARTLATTGLSPRKTLDMMCVQESRGLRKWHIRFSAWLIAYAAILFTSSLEWPSTYGGTEQAWSPIAPLVAAVIAVVVMWVFVPSLHVLTSIEHRGLSFFGARRRVRLGREWTHAICSHGSAGWVFGAGATAIVVSTGYFLLPTTSGSRRYEDEVRLQLVIATGGIVCLMTGFLFFETFAWLGLRRCRFANRVRPGADASGSFQRVSKAQGKEPGA